MENKKQLEHGIRTHDLTRKSLKSYPLDHEILYEGIHGGFFIFIVKILKFSAQRSRKTRDFEKNQYPKYGKNSLNT